MKEWRKEFDRCREIAALAERSGDFEGAVNVLRRAADLLRGFDPEAPDADRARARGEVCGKLGELLWEEHLPAAVQAFQDAADAYGQAEHTEKSVACARKVVEGVRLLRHRPAERLDLLIARFDRDLRELSEQPETEGLRAQLEFKVATVLQRRDRFREAADRYHHSLELYQSVEEGELGQAGCHHRLGDLYHRELRDDGLALSHYRRAISLYSEFEPASEGEQMNRVLCEWHIGEIERRNSPHAQT
jgi:tetratricopeptide (TPR) repeat protein